MYNAQCYGYAAPTYAGDAYYGVSFGQRVVEVRSTIASAGPRRYGGGGAGGGVGGGGAVDPSPPQLPPRIRRRRVPRR